MSFSPLDLTDLVALLAFHVLLYLPQANTGSTSVLVDKFDASVFEGTAHS
jgi:hypothetical protein